MLKKTRFLISSYPETALANVLLDFFSVWILTSKWLWVVFRNSTNTPCWEKGSIGNRSKVIHSRLSRAQCARCQGTGVLIEVQILITEQVWDGPGNPHFWNNWDDAILSVGGLAGNLHACACTSWHVLVAPLWASQLCSRPILWP